MKKSGYNINIHICQGRSKEYKQKDEGNHGNSNNAKDKFSPITGCKSNKWGKCKAQFPKKVYEQTMVNSETGTLDVKKGEPWMNTINPVITYL